MRTMEYYVKFNNHYDWLTRCNGKNAKLASRCDKKIAYVRPWERWEDP